MAVPSGHATAGLLVCSVILTGCGHTTSEAARYSTDRDPQPARFDDIYRTRAPEVVRYDRYTLVSTRPGDAQRDPLNQIIDITVPQLVNTVGEGFRYLLLESGYSLCSATTSVFSELLSRPLPAVQRDVGPVKLSEALQILAGPAWRLKVDEVNREICFVLRDQYRRFDAATAVLTPAKIPQGNNPLQPKNAQSKVSATVENSLSLPRNPFTGKVPPTEAQNTALSPQSLAVPSPVLTTGKVQVTKTSANSLPPKNTPVSLPVSATKVAPQPGSPPAGVHLPAVSQNTVNPTTKASVVHPVTTLPPAPSVSSQRSSSLIPGTPVTTAPVGQTWRAEPGSTLKETLTTWASKAPCSNGGNWVVIWPVSLDYRIDAPLIFHGNFESVMVQVFDLYRKAEKPLFAEANRIQCLISVSDTPAGSGH